MSNEQVRAGNAVSLTPMLYTRVLRPVLFLFDAERAHRIAFAALRWMGRFGWARALLQRTYCLRDDRLRRNVLGLSFPNPVGLAAGFDKNAALTDELALLGFGFIEIGTVTPRPQPGNPPPRLFRLPADRALVNRMGFNNDGAAAAADRLRQRKNRIVIGGNLGKNKTTPDGDAPADYVAAFEALYPVVDYVVVNVSSPNTPGLRALQEADPLRAILMALRTANRARPVPRPVLVKISPDLTDDQVDAVLAIFGETDVTGVVVANTTVSREGLRSGEAAVRHAGAGGLSGMPLKARSTALVRHVKKKSPGLVIIASGGIFGPADALEKIRAGADLVQVYTGFIYEGPGLIRRINEALLAVP